MLKKQNLYGILLPVAVLVACHSSENKEPQQDIQKKDIVKSVIGKEASKKLPDSFLILDTIVGGDTLKVVLYDRTRLRCSLNNLSDTINIKQSGIGWDTSYSSYINDNVAPILIPGIKKPQKFILNDSLLLLPICDGNWRTLLYLLNITKSSLKFSGEDVVYTLLTSSYYIYVDLKNNTIINYADRIYIDTVINGISRQIRRYPIFRYKIINKKIVQINSAISYFKEFNQLEMDNNKQKHVRTFYNTIVQRENWKRDKYKLWK